MKNNLKIYRNIFDLLIILIFLITILRIILINKKSLIIIKEINYKFYNRIIDNRKEL